MKKPCKIRASREELDPIQNRISERLYSLSPRILSLCYIKHSGLFSTKFEHSAAAEIGTAAESAVDRQLC